VATIIKLITQTTAKTLQESALKPQLGNRCLQLLWWWA